MCTGESQFLLGSAGTVEADHRGTMVGAVLASQDTGAETVEGTEWGEGGECQFMSGETQRVRAMKDTRTERKGESD